MNKEKFFKELEKRLQILSEEERMDIINEYKDTLREKVKHGRSEKEAIEDFGSMDELVKNILSAYKINPEYGKEKEEEAISFKNVGNSLNQWIKKCSVAVSNWFQELNEDFKENGQELTIEFITELVIKGILTLFVLALATIPFSILRGLGTNILEMMFFPIHMVLNVIWSFLVGILYFCVAILIVIAMYKDCFPHHKEDKKEKTKEKSKTKQSVTKEETKQVKKNKSGRGFSEVLMILVRVWIVLVVLVPLWCTVFGLSILLAVLIYYTCIGVPLLGPDLLFAGLLLGFSHLIKIIQDVTFHHKRLVFYPFIISIIFVVIGGLLTFDLAMNIEFHDNQLPTSELQLKDYKTKVENINEETNFYIFDHEFDVMEDNSLKDGEVVVSFKYYHNYVTPYYRQYQATVDDENAVEFDMDYQGHSVKKIYHQVLKDLKDKKIYDYDLLYEIEDLKVYANKKTKGFVK